LRKYIKTIVYTFCGIAYSDLIFNPKKGFHFIPFFNKIQIPIVILLILSLFTIIVSELPQNKFSSKIEKLIRPSFFIFLICSLLIFNEIFFVFNFNQGIEFIVTVILSIPIPFIISDLIVSSKIKNIYVLFFGLLLTISTVIYFHFFYTTYEDYWNGIAIIFIHQWIRNWMIFIGLILITTYYLLKIEKKKTIANR
jgi:hypothetical protein